MLSFFWIVRSWLLECTAHGVPRVISTSNFHRKIFWLIAVLFSTGGFLYQITDMIQDVLSHPVAVNVQVIYPDSLKMPTVTICNSNKLKLSSLKQYDNSSLLYKAVEFEDLTAIGLVKIRNQLRESLVALGKQETNTESSSSSARNGPDNPCVSSFEPDWSDVNTFMERLDMVRNVIAMCW